jgi:hypothetical protein
MPGAGFVCRRRLGAAAVGVFVLVLAACSHQQSSMPVRNEPAVADFSHATGDQTPSGQPVTPDSILPSDPAATRLQDIGGFLLLYYNDHHELPQTLDELTQMPGGDQLNLAAPMSRREFSYAPHGLWWADHPEKCIVAFDPDLRGGMRWCLFMTPPSYGAALSVNVVCIPEVNFSKFQAAVQ